MLILLLYVIDKFYRKIITFAFADNCELRALCERCYASMATSWISDLINKSQQQQQQQQRNMWEKNVNNQRRIDIDGVDYSFVAVAVGRISFYRVYEANQQKLYLKRLLLLAVNDAHFQ